MAARQNAEKVSGTSRKTDTAKSSSARTTKKSTASKGRTSTKKSASSAKKNKSTASKKSSDVDYRQRKGMYDEIEMIIALALAVLLLLSIYDLCGIVGNHISYFIFGVFGWIAYLLPYMIFFGTAFYISNRYNRVAVVKIVAGCGAFICLMAFLQMISNPGDNVMSVLDFYEDSAVYRNGGGIIGGAICRLLTPFFGTAGSYLIIIALMAVCIVLFAGKSVFSVILRRIREMAVEMNRRRREHSERMAEVREQERLEMEAAREEEAHLALENGGDARKFLEESTGGASDTGGYSDLVPERNKNYFDQVVGPEDYPDIDDFEYVDEEKPFRKKHLEEEAPKKSRRGRKGQATQDTDVVDTKEQDKVNEDSNVHMIEPEKSYGETVAPIGFELPNLTITRMENIHRDEEPAFDFTPDPVYLEPQEVVEKTVKTSPVFDAADEAEQMAAFEVTAKLPDLSGYLKDEPEMPEVSEIRERTVEEKYTNLPEYVPDAEHLTPAEAVRRAAADASENMTQERSAGKAVQGAAVERKASGKSAAKTDNTPEEVKPEEIVAPVKEYVFPPLDLLVPGKPAKTSADSDRELAQTAKKLQDTLDSFGVKVQVTNVSCGPSVTRYELQPEQGVKVSRILALTDDIKLNLAVADIRIEAPIPGKAAVGIEVPNKENTTVMLRDLLESNEFIKNKSLIAFAAGRDIGGQVIIADIAKMPHLLIAGATGSGKSVCINTLIMSIIYKAKPEDVRMIMIDPKVVELSVYNGIPHLLIPVVTDPKKAAGALNWAVAEMTKRYELFAQLGVRDMKSYNAKIESCEYESDEHRKLPQIVIIVDELADLMMVASNEVEDAICRLAQLARAAGIHLVIATQRPSVNVITGLIKANIPSRIAFSVSSGVDSRTIIDMNGAEKLLGKGDMLFYPTGYQKPVRVQGSFVSDQEVNAVVEFLTKDQEAPVYNESIVSSIGSARAADKASDDHDVYFVEAGKLIIEKDKASIGMLQRVYRIGFNRAARIMDQLCEAGVVGPEEGTKPRKVLMSPEQFEQYIEDYL